MKVTLVGHRGDTWRGHRGNMGGMWDTHAAPYPQEEGLGPAAEPPAGSTATGREHQAVCGDAGTGHPPRPAQQPQQHVGDTGLRLRTGRG